ncbi:MAG: hypothetical protein ACREOR_08860 [Candidatus Binatia bacterium]
MVARAFDGYGEKVEDPGEVRAALQRGLKAVAGGQVALIDVRLSKAVEFRLLGKAGVNRQALVAGTFVRHAGRHLVAADIGGNQSAHR